MGFLWMRLLFPWCGKGGVFLGLIFTSQLPGITECVTSQTANSWRLELTDCADAVLYGRWDGFLDLTGILCTS